MTTYCDDCIHYDVCGEEDARDEAITFCAYKKTEPKTGHWILTDDDFVYCSECKDSYYPRPIDASWYYCPNCGAKMESEKINANCD